MSETPRIRRPWRRRLLWGFGIVAVLLVADWLAACWILWSSYGQLTSALRDPVKHFGTGSTNIALTEVKPGSPTPRVLGSVQVSLAQVLVLVLNYDGNVIEIEHYDKTRLWAQKSNALFSSERCAFAETRRAMAEAADSAPRLGYARRMGLSVLAHPLITGVTRVNGRLCWQLWFQNGDASVGFDGWPRTARVREPGGKRTFVLAMHREPDAITEFERLTPRDAKPMDVPATELDRSLAATIRILALPWQPVPKEPDKVVREGKGWLEVKDGRRVLHLSGTAREIGYQHGKLLAPNIKRMGERILGGVGLAYSLEKGQWFLREAERLVERQRPYIAPEYFEEMQGIAEGAGVPVAMVQAANIFPEFFHCSGAALFGKATKDGGLLHARVLDYMTEVGLQDDAVLMAVERTGARRIVNVSYAGFIGSVTGMNERQVAIGEMGGGGTGKWDGTPMSFLVRGALENSDTLEQALDYMRSHKRTCEYFYVVSDGKSRSACGVAATPEKLDIVGPGQADPRLPDPVPDTVLLSSGDRYKELVKKVRENYGKIGPAELIEIIKRPVAMKSNLHDVIFEPQRLALWVANADRNGPACNQPYAVYDWKQLFRAEP